ncbi:MAG TPA: histidine phosphatase family protein [Methylomirabilota bacterium]|nr:histidine phosphatase family protein [Methylomirabilota bacterium]
MDRPAVGLVGRWLVVLAPVLFGLAGPALGQTRSADSGHALVEALRQGGYVIFFRHARTDFSQRDSSLADCATQRNLSNEGREQARAIGAAIRRLGIPIGRVLASPYCRTRETAELAFGRVEVTRDLLGRGASEEQSRIAASLLRPLLGVPVEPGTNTVLVSHGFNLRAADGIVLAEGEAAIYRPGEGGAFTRVGRLTSDQWTLAERGD